jgi:hypothetical protein
MGKNGLTHPLHGRTSWARTVMPIHYMDVRDGHAADARPVLWVLSGCQRLARAVPRRTNKPSQRCLPTTGRLASCNPLIGAVFKRQLPAQIASSVQVDAQGTARDRSIGARRTPRTGNRRQLPGTTRLTRSRSPTGTCGRARRCREPRSKRRPSCAPSHAHDRQTRATNPTA